MRQTYAGGMTGVTFFQITFLCLIIDINKLTSENVAMAFIFDLILRLRWKSLDGIYSDLNNSGFLKKREETANFLTTHLVIIILERNYANNFEG